MVFYQNYLTNLAQTPSEYYHDMNQQAVDYMWEDSTQVRTIQEESTSFDEVYTTYPIWADTITDITVNTLKVAGNYVAVNFKDIDHTLNYRGQKYIFAIDGVHDETYLCFDKLNPLTPLPDTKLIKCNNTINILNTENGSIHSEPIFVGWEYSATTNVVNKKGTIGDRKLVCLIQVNSYTKNIMPNQRFMLNNHSAFKVVQYDDSNEESTNTDLCTLANMFIEWSPINSNDNVELGICDYYHYQYKIVINGDSSITEPNGYSGTLSATVTLNGNPCDNTVTWASSDESVVTVDSTGKYTIVGNSGSTANIICSLTNNTDNFVNIPVTVSSETINTKYINISPSVLSTLKQNMSQTFVCTVYENGLAIEDDVTCVPNWVNSNYYELTQKSNKFTLTNKHVTTKPLILTFSSLDCESVDITITLGGII